MSSLDQEFNFDLDESDLLEMKSKIENELTQVKKAI